MSDTVIQVADSKLGWAKAFKELIGMLYIGPDSKMGYVVRPTMPIEKLLVVVHLGLDPLESLFNFCVTTFKNHKVEDYHH